MPLSSSSSSSSSSPLLLLLLLLRLAGAQEQDASCRDSFRAGQDDFVLDAEDAVAEGAVLLSAARVSSLEACRRACCLDNLCNLALLAPRAGDAGAADHRACVLFNCIHRNRFVCRFVNKAGYRSYIREAVFQVYLRGPQGSGEEVLPIAIAARDVIVQPGEAVTLSGIQSLALGDAHITKYLWTTGDGNVTMESTELPDQVSLPRLQPGSYDFLLTVTDSNGQRSHAAKVTVMVLNPEQTSSFCRAPLKVGPCRAAFHRWRYDAVTSACELFVFGGCKANENNFLSKDECLRACRGVTASSERSVPLPVTEVCGSVCGVQQLSCGSGCCLDRSLECDGVKQCSTGADEEHCSKLNQTFNRLLDIEVNQKKARCAEPPLTGPCRASFLRWYYDPLNRKCSRFTFGGCEGNDNNFEEEDKCSDTCSGVTGTSTHTDTVFLQEVQSLLLNWKGPDLTTYGELVLEGTFKVHRAKNERTLFLFDRLLLITKRRGEHYAYKTHISCSTLMLIESAKDSLSFSVTHYKHPKQPHTVQARSVEEKKLWAHHIKRIILENHQAIIPQRAKEAILEMDSIYPPRYRLKKASPCQSDEFPPDGRQGSRQSETIKEILKSSKVDHTVVLKEAGEGGVSSVEGGVSSGEGGVSSGEGGVSSVEGGVSSGGGELSLAGGGVSSGEGGGVSSDGRLPKEDESGGTEPTHEQPRENTSESESTENPEPEPSCPDSLSGPGPGIPASPPVSEEQNPEGDPESTEQPFSAALDSDSKTRSSEESSEDEEDEEVKAAPVSTASILPSSVLDKAGAIAQHFSSSIRRSSRTRDEARSPGCVSPRLGAEPADRTSRLNSIGSDPVETFSGTDLNLLSPRDDGLFDVDRGVRRRRDSTLSKQDQLLIGKIRSYYEDAENRDAAFGLQRRESLTYIPTGLVRSSVSRLNSTPREDEVQTSAPASTAFTGLESNPAVPTGPGAHMVSSDSLDSFRSDQRSTDPEDSEDGCWSRSQSLQDNPSEDEEFRPSSEMIEIWQTMEREIGRSRGAIRRRGEIDGGRPRGDLTSSGPTRTGRFDTTKTSNPSGASDLGTAAEGSASPLPLKLKSSGVSRTGSPKVLDDPVLQVARLEPEEESAAKDSNQLDDGDQTKSKVLHLARQYSQRIKTTKPMVLMGRRTLSCVLEEKEGPGKPNPTALLGGHNQTTSPPLIPLDQIQTPGLSGSPAAVDPAPLSPVDVAESFRWPDVRELRSRYSAPQRIHVGRSLSTQEPMPGGSRRRRSSCSLGPGAAAEAPQCREERRQRLHRANSLDPRLSGATRKELRELQDQVYDGYYVAAEAPLPGREEHKILVVEKLPESQAAETERDRDDGFVQIRSPTSREKLSVMAVIDRCRVYQESDEYKQREDARAKAEPTRPREPDGAGPADGGPDHTGEPKTEAGQQSLVKHLREKFQSRS
ncbi:pleckstrin homology domain-containing family G member 3-like [Clinocottus analis]|uniref:pleckstrin homology domain-containing family G member 3-like n=1 Tax=Clinocottus analis TaxID=304258 RepID=UPI0035C21A3A